MYHFSQMPSEILPDKLAQKEFSADSEWSDTLYSHETEGLIKTTNNLPEQKQNKPLYYCDVTPLFPKVCI